MCAFKLDDPEGEARRLACALSEHGEVTARAYVEALCQAAFDAETLGRDANRLYMFCERYGFLEVDLAAPANISFPHIVAEGDSEMGFDHLLAARLTSRLALWKCVVTPTKSIKQMSGIHKRSDGSTTINWGIFVSTPESIDVTEEMASMVKALSPTVEAAA